MVEHTGNSLTVPDQPFSCVLGQPLEGTVSGTGTVSGDGQVEITLRYDVTTSFIGTFAEVYSGTAEGLTLPLAWLRAAGTIDGLPDSTYECEIDPPPTVTFTVTP